MRSGDRIRLIESNNRPMRMDDRILRDKLYIAKSKLDGVSDAAKCAVLNERNGLCSRQAESTEQVFNGTAQY